MKALNLRATVFFYLAGIVLIHLAVLWNLRQMIWKGSSDFTIYYSAGTMVRQGLGHQLYNYAAQFQVQRNFSAPVAARLSAVPYNHPPFEAVFFAPLTYFSYPVALILWNLLNLAMLVSLPFLVQLHLPHFQSTGWMLWLIASLAFFPIFFALLQGQDSILLLLLYTMGFINLARGNDARAGGWLGLGLFKPQLVVPFFLLMFLYGRRRMLYGFLPVAAALGLVSVIIVGWQAFISYPHYVVLLEAGMARDAIVPADTPNLRGVLYLLLHGRTDIVVPTLIVSMCLVLFALWVGRKAGGQNMFTWQFALALVTTVIVSYHCLAYDLSVLFLPVVVVASELRRNARPRSWSGIAIMVAVSVLFFSPLQLVLLLRFNRLALVGWAVLLLMAGIVGQISVRTQHGELSRSAP